MSSIDPLITNAAPHVAERRAEVNGARARRGSDIRPLQIRPAPEMTRARDRAVAGTGSHDPTQIEDDRPLTSDFHSFYVAARPQVGRALLVTLRDPDLAADAVDEAMVRAFQRWEHVAAMDNPSGWVYRVGLNYARSRLKRLLRRPPPRSEVTEFSIADPAIDAAIAQLSVDHRAVVVCRHLLGWSESETATALGIRPGTVKSRLSRALAHLESELHHLRPEGPR